MKPLWSSRIQKTCAVLLRLKVGRIAIGNSRRQEIRPLESSPMNQYLSGSRFLSLYPKARRPKYCDWVPLCAPTSPLIFCRGSFLVRLARSPSQAMEMKLC